MPNFLLLYFELVDHHHSVGEKIEENFVKKNYRKYNLKVVRRMLLKNATDGAHITIQI